MEDLEMAHLDKEQVRYYPVDFASEKFPKIELSLDNWKEKVSQEGREKIEQLIKQEIFKKLGS
jgi:hypothetical protein